MVLSCFRCRDNKSAGAEYQNREYGPGMRVHNATDKRMGGKTIYRCTICENERTKGR